MGIVYGQKKVLASRLLELVSFVFLYPFTKHRAGEPQGITKILLVEPFQMGDVLSLLCMLKPLQQAYPAAQIFMLTKPSSGAIMTYDRRIAAVLSVDIPWSDHGRKHITISRLFRAMRFAWRLRKEKFDLAIDTRGDVRSQILMATAGCRYRLGYTGYLQSDIRLKGWLLTHPAGHSPYPHRYEWNAFLLTKLGVREDQVFPLSFPCFVNDRLLTARANNSLVIHVGGGWEFKRWSVEKWSDLIHRIRDRYDQVTVIGGPGEQAILQQLSLLVGDKGNVIFKTTTLDELVTVLADCSQFIGLDSGPMNLAVCMDKAVIALFGPGDSSMWKPANSKGKYVHKVEKFPCHPCLQLTCAFPAKSCMQEIQVEDVMRLL